MRIGPLVLIIGAVILFDNCRSDKYIPGICFEEHILPIFVSNCGNKGCHNSIDKKEGWDLTTYSGISKGIVAGHSEKSILYKVISGKFPEMPPEELKKLSKQELDIIKSWINFGAKGPGHCNISCDTTAFAFGNNVLPILNSWCLGCHSSASPGGNVLLTDYNTISVVAANGKLYNSVNHTSGFSPMPKNMAKLSDCKIKIIKKWIDAGYPNN